jgi:hypothetical protein
MAPEICPNCGASVPRRAQSCPECGADETNGWAETAYATSLGLPDDDFNYDEFVEREFGPKERKPHGIHWIWYVTALLLLVVFGFFYLRWK